MDIQARRRRRLQKAVYSLAGSAVAHAMYGQFCEIVISPDGWAGGALLLPWDPKRPSVGTEAQIQFFVAGLEAEFIYTGKPTWKKYNRTRQDSFGAFNEDFAEQLASGICDSPTAIELLIKKLRADIRKRLTENWNAVEVLANELLKMVDSGKRTFKTGHVKLYSDRLQEIVEAAFKERVA